MDLVVLPGTKDVILQLCNCIMAFRLISSGDDHTQGMRASPGEYELIDQAAAYGISKSTVSVSDPNISRSYSADLLAPVTRT